MWFRDFFFNCLNAFLSAISTVGGGALDYNGSWIYLILGVVLTGLFIIGCIQIIVQIIAFFSNLPKRHAKVKNIISGRHDK